SAPGRPRTGAASRPARGGPGARPGRGGNGGGCGRRSCSLNAAILKSAAAAKRTAAIHLMSDRSVFVPLGEGAAVWLGAPVWIGVDQDVGGGEVAKDPAFGRDQDLVRRFQREGRIERRVHLDVGDRTRSAGAQLVHVGDERILRDQLDDSR